MKRKLTAAILLTGYLTTFFAGADIAVLYAAEAVEVIPETVYSPSVQEAIEIVEVIEVPVRYEPVEVPVRYEPVEVVEPVEIVTALPGMETTVTVSDQPVTPETGAWKKNAHGRWYRYSDGTWPEACWVRIEGAWYHFDDKGYVQTGWLKDGGKWYYLSGNGAMATGWVKVFGKWYYMNSSGAMQTGWVKLSGKWYYLNKNGSMQTGWVKSGSRWYYLNASGVMQTGWIKLSGKWYYLDKSGIMLALTSRVIGSKRYMFDESGRMSAEMPVSLSDEEIWRYLNEWLGNGYGAAGLMGNLYAESGLKSDNLENTYNNRFGVTDEEYTVQVDSGKRSFIDSAGYGFAQWTYRTRKQNLYDLARSYKTSVADPYMQLEFLRQEIEGNAALYDVLQSAGSVRETSDAVLTRYERPADQSDAVKEKRAALGTGYLERFMQ